MNVNEIGDLGECIARCQDKADYTKIFPKPSPASEERLLFIESGLRKAGLQINRIHLAARKNGIKEILDLLGEQFEFGANVP